MAYTKNNWKCGDAVTAEKLNIIEQGIASGSSSETIEPFYVNYDHDSEEHPYPPVYDKTWQEAYDAFMSGRPVIVLTSREGDIFSLSYFAHIVGWTTYEADGLYAVGQDGYLTGRVLM